MAKMKILMSVGICAALLGACATPTAYQSAQDGYGFSEQQLDETHYRVEFRGNTLTDRSVVETYLLYRAAEVTLESGNDYFIVIEQDVDKKTRYETSYPYPYGGPFRYRYYPYYWDYDMPYRQTVQTSEKFTAVAEIHVGKGPKPQGEPAAYDARSVVANLKDDIVLPEEK